MATIFEFLGQEIHPYAKYIEVAFQQKITVHLDKRMIYFFCSFLYPGQVFQIVQIQIHLFKIRSPV